MKASLLSVNDDSKDEWYGTTVNKLKTLFLMSYLNMFFKNLLDSEKNSN